MLISGADHNHQADAFAAFDIHSSNSRMILASITSVVLAVYAKSTYMESAYYVHACLM